MHDYGAEAALMSCLVLNSENDKHTTNGTSPCWSTCGRHSRATFLQTFEESRGRDNSSVTTEELGLPRHARCALSRLRCNGHSLLLGSYLHRIGKSETPSCSACGHPTQDVFHLLLHCPATNSLRLSVFGPNNSIYDLWSRPWGVARLLGLYGLPPCPHPEEGVG